MHTNTFYDTATGMLKTCMQTHCHTSHFPLEEIGDCICAGKDGEERGEEKEGLAEPYMKHCIKDKPEKYRFTLFV